MNYAYDFRIGQLVQLADLRGEVVDKTRDTVFIKWYCHAQATEYSRSEFANIKLRKR